MGYLERGEPCPCLIGPITDCNKEPNLCLITNTLLRKALRHKGLFDYLYLFIDTTPSIKGASESLGNAKRPFEVKTQLAF